MIVIPSDLWPKTAGELYRIVASVPKGRRVQIVAIRDGMVWWAPL